MATLDTSHTRFRVERVEEVHSGDDLTLLIDLGVDGLYKKVRARLHGVDTPCANKQASTDEAGRVRDSVKMQVRSTKCKVDVHAYGRGGWIVTLYMDGVEETLNDILIRQGYVFKDKKGKKDE